MIYHYPNLSAYLSLLSFSVSFSFRLLHTDTPPIYLFNVLPFSPSPIPFPRPVTNNPFLALT
jgi:hypothetical protein